MSDSQIFNVDGEDPEMLAASERARASFRYFWREVAWERRRIIPALDLACVKAPFFDADATEPDDDRPAVEQMWISDVDFDGRHVTGTLINSPNWLTSVKEGDEVRVPFGHVTDWMYAISGTVFGAFTVNLIRSRMGLAERKQHDAAWGLKFGDPAAVRVAPEPGKGTGLLKGWFGKNPPADADEHPMSLTMAESLKGNLAERPTLVSETDDRGWTLLHQEALAGSVPTVQVLLDAGADPKARTADGRTALELARSLGWENVAALLTRRSS